MSTPKSRKSNSHWYQCESCTTILNNKDVEHHLSDCPPKYTNISYNFIKDKKLTALLLEKNTTDIKLSSDIDFHNFIFLSPEILQLCGFAIGDWVLVSGFNNEISSIAKLVWPSNEKSNFSISLTKRALELSFGSCNLPVTVQKLCANPGSAEIIYLKNIDLISLNNTTELITRLHKSYLNKLLVRGNKIDVLYYGKIISFLVEEIKPKELNLVEQINEINLNDKFFKIEENTKFIFSTSNKNCNKNQPLGKIGGLNEEITEIKALMDICLNKKNTGRQFKPNKSVLLYGHSGTGKSLLALTLASESGANIIKINPTDLYSKYSGTPDETIKILLDDALNTEPSVVIIEELDILCPVRNSKVNESEKKIISQIIYFLDQVDELDRKVFTIALTNKIENIDPNLRKYGRISCEIEIPTPNPSCRRDILAKLLNEVDHDLEEKEIDEIVMQTHGFVGADLNLLCSRAQFHANTNKIKYSDFKLALKKVVPSAMKDVQIEVSNVNWSDIGGQNNLKKALKQSIEWPLKHPESFIRLGITPPKGVLMYGPPGCSKTMIAKALATESELNFFAIKGPELFSKWVGESERAVREVFRKARQVSPAIIFFDEIDALGGERMGGSSTSVQERVLTQLLTELDGVSPLGDVIVVAATNRPDRLDQALLRPGRLDRIVYVPLPDDNTRREIFRIKISKMPVLNVDLEELVLRSDGYSGAEINAICQEAAIIALEEDINNESVTMDHFNTALLNNKPRTSKELLEIYKNFKIK